MGSSEKFCLRWNDFESNISVAFRELREEKDFFDVTLACDDSQVQAHKVILSACSPFFRNILRRNPHQHPLLYIKGVQYKELLSVLNFMYMGEVNVAQDELNSFLAVAEELRVKGLTQGNSGGAAESGKKEERGGGKVAASGGSNNSSSSSSGSRGREPPDRDGGGQPPVKKSRPSVSSIPSVSSTPKSNSQSSHNPNEDDDDIQEVVPVKSEPRDPGGGPNSSTAMEVAHHQGGVTAAAHQYQVDPRGAEVAGGTVALEDSSYQDDGYDYEGYGEEGYDDGGGGGGGYDPSTGLPLAGADGNKGLVVQKLRLEDFYTDGNGAMWATELRLRMHKRDGGGWCCTDCAYFSRSKVCTMSHVQTQHLKGFCGYSCTYCGSHSITYSGLEKHIARQHDWNEEIFGKIFKLGQILHCRDCDYKSNKKAYIISHIQSRHLPEFPGYTCSVCGNKCSTLGGFDKHMIRVHNTSLHKANRENNMDLLI